VQKYRSYTSSKQRPALWDTKEGEEQEIRARGWGVHVVHADAPQPAAPEESNRQKYRCGASRAGISEARAGVIVGRLAARCRHDRDADCAGHVCQTARGTPHPFNPGEYAFKSRLTSSSCP
jgi:hypothetical protein